MVESEEVHFRYAREGDDVVSHGFHVFRWLNVVVATPDGANLLNLQRRLLKAAKERLFDTSASVQQTNESEQLGQINVRGNVVFDSSWRCANPGAEQILLHVQHSKLDCEYVTEAMR